MGARLGRTLTSPSLLQRKSYLWQMNSTKWALLTSTSVYSAIVRRCLPNVHKSLYAVLLLNLAQVSILYNWFLVAIQNARLLYKMCIRYKSAKTAIQTVYKPAKTAIQNSTTLYNKSMLIPPDSSYHWLFLFCV